MSMFPKFEQNADGPLIKKFKTWDSAFKFKLKTRIVQKYNFAFYFILVIQRAMKKTCISHSVHFSMAAFTHPTTTMIKSSRFQPFLR